MIATLLIFFFLPGGFGDTDQAAYDRIRIGKSWVEEPIIAQYTFPVYKHADTILAQRAHARELVQPYIKRVPDAYEQSLRNLNNRASALPDSVRQILRERGSKALQVLYTTGFRSRELDSLPYSLFVERYQGTNVEAVVEKSAFIDSTTALRQIESLFGDLTTTTAKLLLDTLRASIVPTIQLDRDRWEIERGKAEQGVTTTSEIIHQGDIIVKEGDVITEQTVLRLAAYRFSEDARSTRRFSWLSALGSLGHAIVLIAMLALYLFFVRRTSFLRTGQLASLLSMPVLSACLGWLSMRLPIALPLEYTIIVPGMAMLVSILYDVRTAIVVTLACSLSVAASRGNDHIIAVVLMAGGAMAAYSSTNLRSRTQVFRSILAIAVGLLVVTISLELERATGIMPLLFKLGGVGVNAVLSPLLALAVIVIMERAMNLATDLRLEDFDDINHPLIHQLNEHAPGTYQHTMSVMHLSESAASAIGANPLLARVGALYHDIGKIEKSEYFIENQIDIDNKHDRLTPKKSAAIIRQHVQNGITLATDNRLPNRIWKFIPMHHGTMLIKHFYAKALEEAAADGAQLDINDYRYPGPKPDSKETAIVMLADAVDALSRLVNTSQRSEIEDAVDRIIIDRLQDGQLSEAPLTIHDLDIIKESFVKTLLGASHQRVRYMDVKDDSDVTST